MKSDLLKRFLVGLPEKLAFQNTAAIRNNLFKALYYAAANDGEYLRELFPGISDVELMELDGYEFDLDFLNSPAFFDLTADSTYSHPKGTTCARTLRRGEPVYRCQECGFDNTCVLCVHCFNENDHDGHTVEMYLANDKTDGICDCGDTEAFVAPLHCKCQYITDSETLVIPEALEAAILATLRIVLDYIIDVTHFSVSMLPFIHNNINKQGSDLTTLRLSDISSLPGSKYGVPDANSNRKWNLVLWNDEYHNFPEATNAIRAATGVDQLKADEIATEVNNHGRCVLRTGSSPRSLFKPLQAVEGGGLVASIMSARDYMREEIIHHLFQWLSDMLTFNNAAFREKVRALVGDLLLEPHYAFAKSFPSSLIDSFSINVKRRCFENGLLYDGNLVNLGLVNVKPGLSARDLNQSTHLVLEPPPEAFEPAHSRVQLLLVFSMRFTSTIRKMISSVIIPPVMIDTRKKAVFCDQYVQIYPQLVTSLALSDREGHLSCVSEIATQLLTCPTSVQNVLENGKIGFFLGPLIQLIEEHAGKWNYESGYPNFHEPITDDPIKSRSLYEAVSRGIQDISHIVDTNLASSKTHYLLKQENLYMILLFLRNFQGYWTLERKYGDHVEREVLDYFIHLRYSAPVLMISKLIAESDTSDAKLVQSAAQLVIQYLMMRKIEQKAPGIAEFKVSKEPVSFVHPINSFLSYLMQAHDFSNFVEIIRGMNPPFMTISDVSLRSIVLGAQVKIGFWIRNGISVSRQATLYSGTVMIDLAYRRDIHLNQVAALFDDPKTTFYNFLDRWELLEWYTGEVSPENTIYEDRFCSIVEKFILFIYSLITDRSCFVPMSKEMRVSQMGRKGIAYSLSEGPKAYSVIKEDIDSEIQQHPDFDTWLMECADYQPPTGLVDSGMYRLRPELFNELDPYSANLDSSRIEDVSESMIKYIAKSRKIPENEVHLTPQFIMASDDFVNGKIADFTKTVFFAKMVYKLLQVSIDTKDETYLPHLLHLLHAILLDEEQKPETSSIPDAFVVIPIGDLLLNVVDSTLSKAIVVKADFLLSQFITRDSRVIDGLKDCFGEEHVQTYLERKAGLFESESEKRKRLAQERNAKVMKKFERKRKRFLDKNSDFAPVPDAAEKDGELDVGTRNCVLCGEPESTDQVFGILANSVNTSILWKIPQDDPLYFRLAFTDWDENLDTVQDGVYGKGYHYGTKQTWSNNRKYDASVASTCGHGMHYHCYNQAGGRSNSFACPLCHTVQNMFVPSYLPPTDGGGLPDQQLNDDPINPKYNQILHSSSTEKSQALMKSTLHEDLLEMSSLELRKNLSIFCDDFMTKFKKGELLAGSHKKIKYFNVISKISILIADTIRMNEIVSRLDKREGYSNFLQTMPNATKTLLKSLIQCRSILFELRDMPNLMGTKDDFSDQIQAFWDSDYLINGAFDEVVMLFFQTDESFTTLARLGFAKMFSICLLSITSRTLDRAHFSHIAHLESRGLDKATIDNLTTVMSRGHRTWDFSDTGVDKDTYLTCVFHAVEKCMLPFLRQLVMFLDVLTSTNEGDNKHTSIASVSNIKVDIESQSRIDSSDALCKKLSLPTLKELIAGLTQNGEYAERTEFEFKVHDVVLEAKIPKYFEAGVLTLDFPGVIKLIDLPDDYMSCLMDYNERTKNGVYDNFVCLHCGNKFPTVKFYKHMKKCSGHTCLFFHPSKNLFRVITHIGAGPLSVALPGPYLTIHGEVKEPRTSGKATLNKFRYADLNRSWLNQSLHGFITRTLYGTRSTTGVPINNVNFPMTPTMNFDESSDEEDEDYFYSPFAW